MCHQRVTNAEVLALGLVIFCYLTIWQLTFTTAIQPIAIAALLPPSSSFLNLNPHFAKSFSGKPVAVL